MNNNEKLLLSQKQHIKRCNYYYNYGAYRNKQLHDYHFACVDKQQELGRILTTAERRKIYKSCKK